MTRTWLFGEAEYESTESCEENFARLFKCAEACGYMIGKEVLSDGREYILLDGSDLEQVKIWYNKDGSLNHIYKKQFTDRTGEVELLEKGKIVVN